MTQASSLRNRTAWHAGNAAELRIAQEYQRRGFVVDKRRWRGGLGEVDLILRDGAALVFVEVKKSRSFARAAERVTSRQRARIYASAECYLAAEPAGQDTEVRFDVALVDAAGAFHIIENAFGHE